MSNPYKTGSRKAEVYDVFLTAGGGDKGITKATERAKKLGLAGGTVKSWAGSWLKGEVNRAKPKSEKVVREKLPTNPDDAVYFKHDSPIKANRHLAEVCKRSGLRPHAFHVLEQEGMFAVVAATTRPDGPNPQFVKGDTVYDAYMVNSKAKVIEAGPEQCVIRYATEAVKGLSRPKEWAVPNRYLLKLPEETKKKRERL